MASALIGLIGKKRVGKDTFASRLVSAHGYTRIAFADALKATMYDLDPIVRVEADEIGLFLRVRDIIPAEAERLSWVVDVLGWERAKELREVRRLLQHHGVAIRNHVSPTVWVDAVARKVEETPGPVVITDVRFPNEVEYVREAGGTTVRIVNPRVTSTDTHVSETALDDVETDVTVANVGTIEDLHEEADVIASVVADLNGLRIRA